MEVLSREGVGTKISIVLPADHVSAGLMVQNKAE
jgi:hypothetical protein